MQATLERRCRSPGSARRLRSRPSFPGAPGLGLRHLDSPPPAPGWPAVIHPQHAKNHDAV